MKKIFYLALVFILVGIGGCLSEKSSDSIINIVKGDNTLTVKSQKDILGIELKVSGVIQPEDVSVSKEKLVIVKYDFGYSIISIAKIGSSIKNGEDIMTLSNTNGNPTINVMNVVKEGSLPPSSSVTRGEINLLLGDYDTDGEVTLSDFKIFVANYGRNLGSPDYKANIDIAPATKGLSAGWENIYSKAFPDGKIDLLDLIILACNYGKKSPVTTVAIVPASITITGPDSVNVSTPSSFTAKIKYSDSTEKQETVTWSLAATTIASIDANGLLKGFANGNVLITAEKYNLKAQKTVKIVAPNPTTNPTPTANQYTLEQAMSDNAQLSTIAFSGLAFITGSSGADTFMPPGKVADFFGFQYMRDVDTAGYGHNTQFLSRVANNVLYILNDAQKAKMVALAKEQSSLYVNFAYNRFPIMNAFRRSLEGTIPSGSSGLSIPTVAKYTAGLYKTDADLSYNRAVVVGEIINSFTDEQKAYLAKMQFNNFLSWPDVAEDNTLKKSMNNTEFVAVMTYASELFSWYKGSLDADVYFCPERHGTYFGGFYMKDYPAMNNPDYFISTAITGDSGKEFLNTLTTDQRALVTSIIDEQRAALTEVAQIRTTVSTELRKAISGGTIDKAKVYTLIERYGELDGTMSALYASRFSAVKKTLTTAQMATLIKLRNLDVVPQGGYRFSTPVAMPEIASTDYMFGVGTIPQDAGQTTAPISFGAASDPVPPAPPTK